VRWIFTGCLVIVVYDVVAALAARALAIDYWTLEGWPLFLSLVPSTAIYIATGFLAARDTGKARMGALAGGVVAIADSTVGWALSWVIGPGAPPTDDQSPVLVVLTVISVAAIGAAVGLAAGLFAKRVARPSSDAT
jgi:hypothetical protein